MNRAVPSRFDRESAKGAWHVLDVLNGGGKEEARRLLEAMRDSGIARGKRSTDP